MTDSTSTAIYRSRVVWTKSARRTHLAHPVGYTRTLCGLKVVGRAGPAARQIEDLMCARCRAAFEREVTP